MKRPMKRLIVYVVCSLLLALCACGEEEPQPGVVATINGRPITLERLEEAHDVQSLEEGDYSTPSVGHLQNEYGRALADLMVQELVAAELERRGLSVTQGDVHQAEMELRRDFPDDAFEQLMAEEYLDLNFWREQLKARLAWERFLNRVLRPQVFLEGTEVEAYHQAHREEFQLPPRVELTLLHSQRKEALSEALKTKDGSLPEGVTRQQIILEADRVPVTWLAALKDVDQGEHTEALHDESGYLVLILDDRLAAQDMDVQNAYREIESRLVGPRLQAAFDAWLANQLVSAEIKVNPMLLEQVGVPDDEAEPEGRTEGAAGPAQEQGMEQVPPGVPSEMPDIPVPEAPAQ